MIEETEELRQAAEQMIEQFNRALVELLPIWEALREAILKLVYGIIEFVRRAYEFMQRCWLYIKLTHWHCPNCIAKFIANRCPKCWLPALPC